MSQRFSYVKYDEASLKIQERLKQMFEEIERFSEANLCATRPRSLLMTALEEAYMWTGKALRDDQISRGSQTEHVAERTDE